MVSLLKRYDLRMMKIKFIIIYTLNASDIIFTLLLLQTGVFAEGNLLMAPVVDSKLLSLFLKIILPLILLIILYTRIRDASEKQLRIGNILVDSCMILYVLVNFSHIIWIISYKVFLC